MADKVKVQKEAGSPPTEVDIPIEVVIESGTASAGKIKFCSIFIANCTVLTQVKTL